MLALTIKRKWFNMILSGEKKEEYRDIKDYYKSRFSKVLGMDPNWLTDFALQKSSQFEVKFNNGYSKDCPSFIADCSLSVGEGKEEWGAEKGKCYGNKIMTTQGEKINIEGNAVKSTSYDSDGSVITGYELSSVITINIDGKEIQSCGDTCIFEQNGLNAEVNFTQEDIQSQLSGAITDNTIIAGIVNKYKNSFGKSRVVVIKSQLGQPITAYSGDKVYWKIPQDLPKMTKLMIDGKALYIHRANFQIIDKELLK